MPEGDAESLRRHLDWLYGKGGVYPGNVPCKCEHAYKPLGRFQGIDMGKGWVRMTTHPKCPHHGEHTANYPFKSTKRRK